LRGFSDEMSSDQMLSVFTLWNGETGRTAFDEDEAEQILDTAEAVARLESDRRTGISDYAIDRLFDPDGEVRLHPIIRN
jgi:hypothetical protein